MDRILKKNETKRQKKFTEDADDSDGDVGELRLYGPHHVEGIVFATGRDPICDLRVTRGGERVIATHGGYIKVWNIEKNLSGKATRVEP